MLHNQHLGQCSPSFRWLGLCLALAIAPVFCIYAQDTSASKDSLRVKSKDEPEQIVDYEAADSILVDFSSNQAQLMGKVKIRFGSMELQSGRAFQNWRSRSMKALPIADSLGRMADTPRFVDGTQSFVADSM
ncbi:MAG: hypothetical protein ACKOX4_05950, partial [Bacteroidota bacterium]